MIRRRCVPSRVLAFLFVPFTIACSTATASDVANTDATDTPADVADAPVDLGPLDAGPPCRTDSDCTDSVFCNGAERCLPGAPAANARGCAPASPATACASNETCDEAARICRGGCADADGDGHGAASCGGDDCDDNDAQRFPGHPEVCDSNDHDEDCNALTFGIEDRDVDGETSTDCCNVGSDGTPHCGRDCDDTRASVRPGLPEVCDSLDNDCNGATDDGAGTPHYVDADHDGFGVASTTPLVHCGVLAGYADNDTDCNDADSAIHPGALEPCDGVDNNCNAAIDDGPLLVACRSDADGDGALGSTPVSMASCTCPAGQSSAPGPYDCDDADVNVHPGQTTFFTSARSDGSFDYNCDGSDEQENTRTGSPSCSGTGAACNSTPAAWSSTTPPACGSGASIYGCSYTPLSGCLPAFSYQVQRCR